MNSRLAYVFPGQGSQSAGMGRELFETSDAARKAFEEADDALGFSLSKLCFEGPTEELQLTENTQPAILTTSVAALRSMREAGFDSPGFVAGHSLGEYSALVAAGAISLTDAVKTVRARGRYMQEAAPVGSGAMAAVLGAEFEIVEKACREAAEGEICSPANINSGNQVVIAGSSKAVDRAIVLLKTLGAKRAVRLNVSAPFHCALMMPAQVKLEEDLGKITFHDLRIPLVTNADAEIIDKGTDARDALVRQVSSPVRWRESMEKLIARGVDRFIEVGPGKVLTGLIRQIDRGVNCSNVEDSASLEQARLFQA